VCESCSNHNDICFVSESESCGSHIDTDANGADPKAGV
jgi:hypothetical protein